MLGKQQCWLAMVKLLTWGLKRLQRLIFPYLSHTGAKVVMHSIVHDLINNTGRAITRKVGDMLSKKAGKFLYTSFSIHKYNTS